MPTISLDFCFLCQKDQGKSIPTMVARDHKTIYTSAFTCPGKSTKEEEYSDQIVERCQNCVNSLGYKRVAMKSDQEKSMSALQQRVQKGVNCEMVLTNSKKYDSKSNGKIEKAVQDVEGQVRTLKLHLENRIGEKIPPKHPMIHWMVEYAAETINRFRIVKRKATPREMLRGKHELRKVAEFGDSVLCLPETWESGRIEQLEPKFESGIWLGVCPRTDEAIIGTPAGVVRAGSVKRRTLEEAWKAAELLAIKETP